MTDQALIPTAGFGRPPTSVVAPTPEATAGSVSGSSGLPGETRGEGRTSTPGPSLGVHELPQEGSPVEGLTVLGEAGRQVAASTLRETDRPSGAASSCARDGANGHDVGHDSPEGLPAAEKGDRGTPAPVPLIEVYVFGKPAGQGSKRAIVNRHTGRAAVVEASARTKPWREAVKSAVYDAASANLVGGPDTCPFAVEIVCTFDKPKSAPKRRRTWPTTRSSGDADKLARSCLDAITDVGLLWRDDSQVTDLRVRKVFVGEDPDAMVTPGARIRVWAVGE